MTPPAPPTAVTFRELLFGGHDEAVESIRRTLAVDEVAERFGSALGRLSAAATHTVRSRVAETAAGLFETEVADVLAAGWQRYAVLANAALRTRRTPGSEELVDLVDHQISSLHQPAVDVVLDGVTVVSVVFDLRFEAVVRGLVATVRAGRLTALESGRCTLTARLSCFDVTIAERESELRLGAVLDLGQGWLLVPGDGGVARRAGGSEELRPVTPTGGRP